MTNAVPWSLAGTTVFRAAGVEEIKQLDWEKLERLVANAFGRLLVPHYKELLLANPDADVRIYYAEGFSAAAIIRFLPGSGD
jgi:hypothetical protein